MTTMYVRTCTSDPRFVMLMKLQFLVSALPVDLVHTFCASVEWSNGIMAFFVWAGDDPTNSGLIYNHNTLL